MITGRFPCPLRGKRSFPARLTALVLAVNVFALVLAALALINSHHHHRRSAETTSQNLTQVLEQSVGASIDRIDDALSTVAAEIQRQDRAGIHDEAALAALMERLVKRTPGIVGLRTSDALGQVRLIAGNADGSGTRRAAHAADRDYFIRLRDDPDAGLVISEPILGRITNQWMVIIARRVSRADGSFAGVVFAPVALHHFTQSFAKLNLGAKGAVALRDASMAVVARYPEVLAGGDTAIGARAISPELATLKEHSPQGGTYYAKAGVDGIARTLSFRKVGDHPLYVVVGLSADEYLAEWWTELARTLVMFALFTPLTVWAARRMLRSWHDEEAALERASEASARLSAVLGSAPIGLAIVDHDRRIQEANDALAEIFGVPAEGLKGNTTQALYATENDYRDLGARAYPVVRQGRTFSDIVTMSRRDGSPLSCKLIGRLVDPAMPELGYVWIFEDISEQIATTRALRASEERFRALVEGVRDYAILLLDPNGLVQTWNQGAQAIKGYDAGEILGQSFTVFYPPEDTAAGLPLMALEEARRTGRWEGEGWRVRKDGSRFWASIVLTALRGEDGAVRGFAKISRDVTERRQAEEEIQRLASYQQAILANTPVGIAILGLDRTIMHANDAFCRIYGREGEQLAGLHASILYSDPAQSQYVKDQAYPLVLSGGTFEDDVLMSRRDGSTIWVRLVAHLVDNRRPELGVVWAAQDISTLKELNESLMRSNAELERFAYVASHDLRQPLRMISSYMGLIERRLRKDGSLDDEMREFLGYAVDGAQRMDRMIVDMLDYSRIGRQSSPRQDVPLAEPLQKALNNLAATIDDTGAEIAVSEFLPVVSGSASELERLFQNLVGNALKFRAEDRPPRVSIDCRETATEWIISVADNGIGIDPLQHDRLFALFSRLVSPQQYEGTGIGLAACRKIAEHHGGRIWVESPPEGGSVFRVALARQKG